MMPSQPQPGKKNPIKAIVLAGGLGTRLREAVPEWPKCLAPVAGKPFLAWLLQYFSSQGIRGYVFALGYRKEMFLPFLDGLDASLSWTISEEEEPLGTGGAIRKACSGLDDESLLILNGDSFLGVRVNEFLAAHEAHGADCTLALHSKQDTSRYGRVELNSQDRVISFQEKMPGQPGLINGGVYLLRREPFMNLDLPEKFSFEKDFLEKEFGHRAIYGNIQPGYFIDIGIPADYERAQRELPENID